MSSKRTIEISGENIQSLAAKYISHINKSATPENRKQVSFSIFGKNKLVEVAQIEKGIFRISLTTLKTVQGREYPNIEIVPTDADTLKTYCQQWAAETIEGRAEHIRNIEAHMSQQN